MSNEPQLETARLDIVSDAICPWCFIGKRQLERALPQIEAAGLRLDVFWHPFQLNPDMPEGGVARADYRARKFGSAERAKELDEQVVRAAASVDLAFRVDLMLRTPNTVQAHRLAWYAARFGATVHDAVVEAMFRAYFLEGRDIGASDVLADCARLAGLADAEAFLSGDEGRAEIIGEDAAFRRAGLSGVPSFVMDRHLLFSGAMPADTMAEAIVSAWRVLRKRAA